MTQENCSTLLFTEARKKEVIDKANFQLTILIVYLLKYCNYHILKSIFLTNRLALNTSLLLNKEGQFSYIIM